MWYTCIYTYLQFTNSIVTQVLEDREYIPPPPNHIDAFWIEIPIKSYTHNVPYQISENKSKTHDLFKTTPGKKKYSFYT